MKKWEIDLSTKIVTHIPTGTTVQITHITDYRVAVVHPDPDIPQGLLEQAKEEYLYALFGIK